MRRRAPRPLSVALGQVRSTVAPASLLGRVQGAWAEAVTPAVAAQSQPVSERSGSVTIACASSVWASELSLMENDLLERLNGSLGGGAADGPVRGLRFVTRSAGLREAGRRR